MRKYKFRAWDKVLREFPFVGFHIIGECTAFDLIKQYQLEQLNDLVISQYTGINDKNGKEIYEGDIVCIGDEHDEEDISYGLYTVFYKNGAYWVDEKRPELLLEFAEVCNVVGNVFENIDMIMK